jgi:hypothetical protein
MAAVALAVRSLGRDTARAMSRLRFDPGLPVVRDWPPVPRGLRRIQSRPAVVLALATAGALAVTGLAFAASSNVSVFSFSPSNPHSLVTSGRLAFGTNTTYSSLTETTTRMRHNLDDDFHFNPDSFPKCNPADISGNLTMQQALQECGPAAGAANNAWLFPATGALSNGKARFNLAGETPTACVLVFNGSGSTSEILLFIRAKVEQAAGTIDCASPTTNTEGDTSFLVQGDLKANPAIGGDYTDPDNCSPPDPRRGCQIDLNNVSNGPMRLDQLFVRVGRGKYVRARCVDPPAGNRKWNLRTMFTYANPAGTQTVNKSQTCT